MRHGLEGEASYGYEGSSSEGECRFREERVLANITGLGVVWPSEDKLQEAVATQVQLVLSNFASTLNIIYHLNMVSPSFHLKWGCCSHLSSSK